MKILCMLLFAALSTGLFAATPIVNRPQKLAMVKAHSILPQTLKWIVKKNGKALFRGLDQGMRVPRQRIDVALIQRENQKIPTMVNRRAPFSEIVHQMGYVSGLLAVFLDPSRDSSHVAQKGFAYYLDYKLGHFLFVFDGYEALMSHPQGVIGYVATTGSALPDYRRVLERQYRRVNGNHQFRFGERSPVFGVCSIYFSNLARVSAQLWRHGWSQARGDLGGTPFVKRQNTVARQSRGSRR